MPNRTDQPPEQHSPAPEPTWVPAPGRVLSESSAVQQCEAEYAAGARIRYRMHMQAARARR
jgi:hypothetical protein